MFVLPFGHMTAVRSVLYLLTFVAAFYAIRGGDWVTPPIGGVFAVWMVSALTSLIGAIDPYYSVQQIRGDILYSLLGFCAAFFIVRNIGTFRVIRLASILSAFGLSVVAIGSYAVHGEWLIGYQNSLGFFTTSIVTVMPLCLSVFLQGGLRELRAGRILAGVAFATAFVGCYLAGSRATWPILLLTPFVFWLQAGNRPRFNKIFWVSAFVLSAAALASISAHRNGREISSISDRIPIYQTAIKEIAANYLTGTGFGRESNRNAYRMAIEKDKSIRHAHSLLLSYPEQMGILGLVTLIVMFGGLIKIFTGNYRSSKPHENAIGLVGLLLTVSVFLKSTTDMFFTGHNLVLFWIHCGVLLGVVEHLRNSETQFKTSSRT